MVLHKLKYYFLAAAIIHFLTILSILQNSYVKQRVNKEYLILKQVVYKSQNRLKYPITARATIT